MCGNRIIQAHFALERTRLDILAFDELRKMKIAESELNNFHGEIIIKNNALIERIIVNLENIFEIHNELDLYLEEKYPQLRIILEELWNKILDVEKLIGIWRNNITAHGKFMGKKYHVTLASDLGSVKQNVYAIILASALVTKYIEIIFANVKEYQEAYRKLEIKANQAKEKKNESIEYLDYYKARKDSESILSDYNLKLSNAGFKNSLNNEI